MINIDMEIPITHIPVFEEHENFIKEVETNREHKFKGKTTEKTNTVYKGNHDGKDIFVLCTINWVKQDVVGMTLYKPFVYSVTYHNKIDTIIPHLMG